MDSCGDFFFLTVQLYSYILKYERNFLFTGLKVADGRFHYQFT